MQGDGVPLRSGMPVLAVESFTDKDEVLRLGHDTIYGLAGAVCTSDSARAHRVASALRHSTVWINDYPVSVVRGVGRISAIGRGPRIGSGRSCRVCRAQAHSRSVVRDGKWWFGSEEASNA